MDAITIPSEVFHYLAEEGGFRVEVERHPDGGARYLALIGPPGEPIRLAEALVTLHASPGGLLAAMVAGFDYEPHGENGDQYLYWFKNVRVAPTV